MLQDRQVLQSNFILDFEKRGFFSANNFFTF